MISSTSEIEWRHGVDPDAWVCALRFSRSSFLRSETFHVAKLAPGRKTLPKKQSEKQPTEKGQRKTPLPFVLQRTSASPGEIAGDEAVGRAAYDVISS